MNQKVKNRLGKEVAAWAEGTEALVSSCRQLIDYFGSPKEIASWDAAIAVPAAYIDAATDALTTRIDSASDVVHPRGRLHSFTCSKDTARIIAPILQVVGGPFPPFIRTIRTMVRSSEQNALLTAFGLFSGNFAMCVCEPIWQRYYDLAPKEWVRLNPRSPQTTDASRVRRLK